MFSFLIKFLKTVAGTICTAIAFIQFFFGIEKFSDIFKGRPSNSILNSNNFLVFSIVVTIIVFVFQLIQYRKKSKKAKKTGQSFSDAHVRINEYIATVEDKLFVKPFSDRPTFYDNVGMECGKVCEDISNFISGKTNKNFSVCIKLLNSVRMSKESPEAESVYTLCRSGKDRNEREKAALFKDKEANKEREIFVPVSSNTAFNNILVSEDDGTSASYFASSNLGMKVLLDKIMRHKPYSECESIARAKYENANKDFLNHYRSTIVVPIRIETKKIKYDLDEGMNYRNYITLGFLCLDYRKPISKALLKELVEYAIGFSSSLFLLLYKIHKCDIIIQSK